MDSKVFEIRPVIHQINTVEEFLKRYQIGSGDLVIISEHTYTSYFSDKTEGAVVVDYRKYGKGEPTDTAVDALAEEIGACEINRVFAIGGGTALDIGKIFALKQTAPAAELFHGKIPAVRCRKLILVPTTCGTGSEVTDISILSFEKEKTKFGLALPELYADEAVLVPELMEQLPYSVFAASSIDALVHAIESFTSPKANEFTRMYSREAIRRIVSGYRQICEDGKETYKRYLSEFLTASTMAGIAFGNAGCAAVHAMSYPLGAAYHVPHGESNYVMFAGVYQKYIEMDPEGPIRELTILLAQLMDCNPEEAIDKLDLLLSGIIAKKRIREYGVGEEELKDFTKSVMTKQTRLMNNNYVPLTEQDVLEIYKKIY